MNELHLPFDTDLIVATAACDDFNADTFSYYIRLSGDVVDWCDQYLTKPASIVVDTSETIPGYLVVFACTNDLLHFKLRWI